MLNLGDIIQQRMSAYSIDPKGVEESIKARGKEYHKRWNDGVQYFQLELNKDRKREGMKPVSFMQVRMKLIAMREVEDLKWLYFACKKYSQTKDKFGNQNTFSKMFWGSLKIR